MAEWFKNMYMYPLNYGLEKMNYIAVNVISVIFNLYGKRLLNLDDDKIIKHNECKNDINIFYMYPLHLKQIEQDIGLNVVKIELGIIENVVVTVPWKSILSEPTLISIDDITLNLSMIQRDHYSIHLSSLENTNPYFVANRNSIKENQDLIDTYHEINSLLFKYINSINLDIKVVKINLASYFHLTILGIKYFNSIVTIDKLELHDSTHNTLAMSMTNIEYSKVESRIKINNIKLTSSITEYLPIFYVDNCKSSTNISMNVEYLQMDDLIIKHASLTINDDLITINKVSSIEIDKIVIIKYDNIDESDLLLYDKLNNKCNFYKTFDIKFSNPNTILDWINDKKKLFHDMCSKVIVIDLFSEKALDPVKSNSFMLSNLSANLIYGDDILKIDIGNASIDSTSILDNIGINCGTTVAFCHQLTYINNLLSVSQCNIKSAEYVLQSDLIQFNFESKYDITLKKANISNIDKFIDAVSNLTSYVSNLTSYVSNLMSSTKTEESKLYPMINLHVIETDILCDAIQKLDTNLIIRIKSALLCITTKEATSIDADILLNEYIIAKICIALVSRSILHVAKIQFYIDPEIFDQLNYLCSTLSIDNSSPNDIYDYSATVSEQGLKQLQQALERSMISSSIAELEKTLNTTTNTIMQSNQMSVDMLITSFVNIQKYYIADYEKNQTELNNSSNLLYTINIKSLHCYLYDKLPRVIKETDAFMCILLKSVDITIERIEQQIVIQPLLTILEEGKKPKPNSGHRFTLIVKNGCAIDIGSRDPEWKYFAKFSKDVSDAVCNILVDSYGDCYCIDVNMKPIIANIREVTLLRILAFFSSSHNLPDSVPITTNHTYIEKIDINSINVELNYYPLILNQVSSGSMLALKKYRIKLSPISLSYVDSFSNLIKIIGTKYNNDVNPSNMLQFVPNINIIRPYASPCVQIVSLISHYFKHSNNKLKIRALTRNINAGVDILSAFVKQGVEHVIDLFK